MQPEEAKELESLFRELRAADANTASAAIDAEVRQLFAGGSEEQQSRHRERQAIEAKIAELAKELRKHRNLRGAGPREAQANANRAAKRRRIRDEISALKFRLADIAAEQRAE